MKEHSAQSKKTPSCRLMRTLCAAVLLCALFGCGQAPLQQRTEPDHSAVESAAGSESLSGEETVRSKTKERAASSADTAKKTGNSVKKPSGNTALSKKWKADITRLAESSGMEVSVSALDLTSGAAASYHSDRKMLSASMIKLLIAETFLRQVSEGKHSFDDVYVLQASDIVGGTGTLQTWGAGAEVTNRELFRKMISESDNVAANVLIDLCGMDAINQEAARLKLKHTELGRHFMRTNEGHDNYICADDIVTLLKMVYDKTFVNEKMSELMLDCLEAQEDDRCISKGLPEGTVFAHKTGSLDSVRHDGGIVEGEKPFVLVVLCGGEGFSLNAAQELMGRIGQAAYRDVQTS